MKHPDALWLFKAGHKGSTKREKKKKESFEIWAASQLFPTLNHSQHFSLLFRASLFGVFFRPSGPPSPARRPRGRDQLPEVLPLALAIVDGVPHVLGGAEVEVEGLSKNRAFHFFLFRVLGVRLRKGISSF